MQITEYIFSLYF